MPSLTGVHHVSLTVTDLDRSAEWYSRVLGFTLAAEIDGDGYQRVRLRHPDSGLIIALTHHKAGSGEAFRESECGLDHVAFTVPDVADITAWKQRLEHHQVPHSQIKPREQPGGGALITLRDPDNIQIEVVATGEAAAV